MIQVTYSNNQIKITSNNSQVRYYSLSDIKSLSYMSTSNGISVLITFINENRDAPLTIELSKIDLDYQPLWTNDVAGATQAVNDIASWKNVVDSNLVPKLVYAQCFTETETTDTFTSISEITIKNIGNADGIVSTDTSGSSVTLPSGEQVHFSAGGLNNFLEPISIDCTNTTFLVYLTRLT